MEIIVNGEKIAKNRIDQEINMVRSTEPTLSEKKASERAADRLVRQILLRQDAAVTITSVSIEDIEQ